MSGSYPPIAASESKATFMHSIGLQSGHPEHERLYKLMKQDAVNAYRRVVQERQAGSSSDGQQASKPRYAYTEIDKDIIRDAIATIYQQANERTKPFYDRGVDPSGEGNWVIRWLLWHIFRYRDSRNKRPPTMNVVEYSASIAEPEIVEMEGHNDLDESHEAPAKAGFSLPYDPVRG